MKLYTLKNVAVTSIFYFKITENVVKPFITVQLQVLRSLFMALVKKLTKTFYIKILTCNNVYLL